MIPMTTAMPSTVAKPEIIMSRRIFACRRACAGSRTGSCAGSRAEPRGGAWIASVGAWAPDSGKVMVETPDRIETLVVEQDHDGERLDRALAAQVTALSRTRLKALVLAGRVAIGGRPARRPRHSPATRRPTPPLRTRAPRDTPP